MIVESHASPGEYAMMIPLENAFVTVEAMIRSRRRIRSARTAKLPTGLQDCR